MYEVSDVTKSRIQIFGPLSFDPNLLGIRLHGQKQGLRHLSLLQHQSREMGRVHVGLLDYYCR
jgi:hypothetical protein